MILRFLIYLALIVEISLVELLETPGDEIVADALYMGVLVSPLSGVLNIRAGTCVGSLHLVE